MRRKEKERVIGGGLCIYIGAKQKIQLISWLALLQCVERQAQHRPDRLKKPRTRSVGTDRLGRVRRKAGSVQRTRRPLGKIFRREYILGVSVELFNEH